MHLNKESDVLVIDLINATEPQVPLKVGDVTFDAPVEVVNNARNTSVVIRGVREKGFRGQRTMRYDRLNLALVIKPTEGQVTEVPVPNDGFETKLEVCDRLNKQYNLKIGPKDIIDGPVDTTVLPAKTTIQTRYDSLAWFGALAIEFVPDRPFYKDTFSSFVLDGLPMPETPNSGLKTTVVTNNAAPSFVTEDSTLHQPGNGSYPAGSFVVSHNSEIELALAPRVGMGGAAVAPAAMGYDYNLSLADANDWRALFSIGSLAGSFDELAAKYNITMVLTGPDKTELVLTLVVGTGDYAFVNTAKNINAALVGTTIDDDALQWSLSMRDMSAHLGAVSRNAAGAPLGSYVLRLMARRINMVVPRVLSTVSVKVAN